MKIKEWVLFASCVCFLSGCQTSNGSSLFQPEVIAGNAGYVTVYDSWGIPGKTQQIASQHCAMSGKIAVFNSKNGDDFRCSGTTLCSTYYCQKR